ncbi:hypothetical protein SAMN04488527_101198 [Aliiroseovarius crassostreae]|nr:hypothetical protein SAMN04488527_101198 [Aliiroseovarius crassostreae]
MMLTALHHVQLAMPKGQEGQAGRFYADLLGLSERPKPASLSGRGGVWFEKGALRLHLGVEEGFAVSTPLTRLATGLKFWKQSDFR